MSFRSCGREPLIATGSRGEESLRESNRQTTVHRTGRFHPGPRAAEVASLAAGDVQPDPADDRRPALVQDDAMVRRCGYRDRRPPPRPTRQGDASRGRHSQDAYAAAGGCAGPDNADPARHGYARRQRRDEPQISPCGEAKTGQSTAATHTGSCPAESAGVMSSATVQT